MVFDVFVVVSFLERDRGEDIESLLERDIVRVCEKDFGRISEKSNFGTQIKFYTSNSCVAN